MYAQSCERLPTTASPSSVERTTALARPVIGFAFSFANNPKCRVSRQRPVRGSSTSELPPRPRLLPTCVIALSVVDSSPVKYSGRPSISASVDEQKRRNPSLPLIGYHASSTRCVRGSRLRCEIRAPDPVGLSGPVASSSWFISTSTVSRPPSPSSSSPPPPRAKTPLHDWLSPSRL